MPRVALLTNFVSPYRAPVFRRIAAEHSLRILVNSKSEFDRSWDTEYSDLDVRVTKTWTRRRTIQHTEPVPFEEVVSQHLPLGLFWSLLRYRPDVIVSGELGPRSIVATIYGKLFRVPVVLWSYHSRASSAGTRPRRRAVWKWLLKRCTAVVGMGTQAREVLVENGVPEGRIFDAWNAPDVSSIEARLQDPKLPSRVEAIRAQFADDRRMAVVIGRLVPLKGISELLSGWRELPDDVRSRWRLVFVGDGPLRSLICDSGDQSIVHAGAVSPTEVTDWFRAADLHVFASLGDVWGLVVNEALLCSTPTLCSSLAGACEDLIEHGVNGLVFDPGNPESRVARLQEALEHHDLGSLGRAGRASAQACTVDRFARGFLDAIHFAGSDGKVLESAPETSPAPPGASEPQPGRFPDDSPVQHSRRAS